MAIIEAADLRKVFRRIVRRPGIGGAVRALFSREYEDKVAVDGVNFTLAEGELVGYLGPNGAGKSTTIKILTGILVPTSGSVRVAGVVRTLAHDLRGAAQPVSRESRALLRDPRPRALPRHAGATAFARRADARRFRRRDAARSQDRLSRRADDRPRRRRQGS